MKGRPGSENLEDAKNILLSTQIAHPRCGAQPFLC